LLWDRANRLSIYSLAGGSDVDRMLVMADTLTV